MSSSFESPLVVAYCLLLCSPLIAPVFYLRAERAHRHLWQRVERPRERIEGPAYRSAGLVLTGYLDRAPGIVRLAACTSIIFGAAFLPGLAFALFGLLWLGIGLLGIPGLVVAAWLWKSGHGLLRRTEASAYSAARAATASIYLNIVIVLGVGVLVLLGGELALAACSLVYPLLSIAQAVVVAKGARVVARTYDEDVARAVEKHLPFFMQKREVPGDACHT